MSRSRPVIASVAALILGFATVLVTASPASAAEHTVSGTVTFELTPGTYGAPTDYYNVHLFDLSGTGAVYTKGWNYGASWQLDVPDGTYRVQFIPAGPGTSGSVLKWATTWYGNTPFEFDSPVVEVAGSNVTGIDVTMPLGGSIYGNLSDRGGSKAEAFVWSDTADRWVAVGWDGWSVYSTGDYRISSLPAGDYLVRFTTANEGWSKYWNGSDDIGGAEVITLGPGEEVTGIDMTFDNPGPYVTRLSGPSRFETAVAVSEAFFEPNAPGDVRTPAVFITNGYNFPDALSAGPAAALLGAPILLVTPTSVPAAVIDEIERIDPPTIYILGGPPAVSEGVADQLAAYGDVVRISGPDRYSTSRAIAEEFFTGEDIYTAYFATGLNFPDALAAGPAAANEFGPVILHNGLAGAVDAGTAGLIADLDIERIVIAGSSVVVTTALERSLFAQPSVDEIARRAGVNRYDTGKKINGGDGAYGIAGSFDVADHVFLATGVGFPDALAGSSVAGALDAPIYLVQPNCVPVAVIEELLRLQPKYIWLLGGPPALGPGVESLTPC